MNTNTKNSRTLLCHLLVGTALAFAVGACDDPVDVEPTPGASIASQAIEENTPIDIETTWRGQCSDEEGLYACLPQAYELDVRCADEGCIALQTDVVGAGVIRFTSGSAGDVRFLITMTNLETDEVFETQLDVTVVAAFEPVAGSTLENPERELLDEDDVGSSTAIDDGTTLPYDGGELGPEPARDGSGRSVEDTIYDGPIGRSINDSIFRKGDDERSIKGGPVDRPRFAPGSASTREKGNQFR